MLLVGIDYFAIFLSAAGTLAVGLTLHQRSLYLAFLFGLTVQGLILSVSIWLAPKWTTEIVALTQSSFLIILILRIRSLVLAGRPDLIIPNLGFGSLPSGTKILVSMSVAFVFAASFRISEYPFNSHDSVYWGFTFEALVADYFGPLRSPVLSPLQLTVTHVAPMTALSALLAYVPEMSLVKIIQCKHLLIVLFFSRFFYNLICAKNGFVSIFYGLVLSIFSMLIYEGEIGYSLLINSYLYLMIVCEAFRAATDKSVDLRILTALFIALAAMRAPISLAPASAGAFLLAYLRFNIGLPAIMIGALSLCTASTWALLPKAYSMFCGDGGVSLASTSWPDYLRELSQVREWLLPGLLSSIAELSSLAVTALPGSIGAVFGGAFGVLVLYFYVFLKFYMPPIFLVLGFESTDSQHRAATIALLLYLAVGAASILFLRVGDTVQHQFHAFLLLAAPCVFSLIQLGMRRRALGSALIAVGVASGLYSDSASGPFALVLSKGIAADSLSLDDLRGLNSPRSSELRFLWHAEVSTLANGERRQLEDLSGEELMTYFSREPDDRETIASLWVSPSENFTPACKLQ